MRDNSYLNIMEFWTRKKIPYIFDETLSLYQLVRLTVKYLNEVIKDQNELKDAIKEFIEMFDEDLEGTVIEVLEKWKDDGSLKEIINEALFESKLDKSTFEEHLDDLDKYKEYVENNKIDIEMFEKIPKPFNIDLALRVERSDKYKGVQGSCIIDDTMLLAFVDDTSGVLAQYDIETGKLIRQSEPLDFYHANGIDYNPENNLIYVAATWDGEKDLNTVYRYNYDDFTFHSTIAPQGKTLSKEKNIRWVSYDKAHKKLYIGSNFTAYHVTNDLVEIETFEFDKEYLDIKNTINVQQGGAVHDGYYYHGSHAEQSITVFRLKDGKAKYVLFNDLQATTRKYRGHFFGAELQSVSLKENGDIFIAVRWGSVGDTVITYVYKGNVYRNTYINRQYYMESPLQNNYIKIDPKSMDPRPDGFRTPYNNLKEAIINTTHAHENRPFKLALQNGVYKDVNITVPNTKIYIERAGGGVAQPENVIIEDVVVNNADVSFQRVTLKKNKRSYALENNGGNVKLGNGVIVDNDNKGLECVRNLYNGVLIVDKTLFKNANRPIYAFSGIITGEILKENVSLEVNASPGVLNNIKE